MPPPAAAAAVAGTQAVVESRDVELKMDVANQKERLLKTLSAIDTAKSGTVSMELVERAFLDALQQPLNMFPGGPERPEESMASFIHTTMLKFEGNTVGRIDYGKMVEWLFDDAPDAAAGSPALREVMDKARKLHHKREQEFADIRRKLNKDNVVAGAADQEQDSETWSIALWLEGKISKVLADALTAPLAEEEDPKGMQFTFAQALGHSVNGEEVILELLQRGGVLRLIASEVAKQAKKLTKAEAATGKEMNSKFAADPESFDFVYGSASAFYCGLESIVGSPDPRVLKAMQVEHCDSADSRTEWTTGNYGISTTPEIEWHFVTLKTGERDSWRPEGAGDEWRWPEETKNATQDGKSVARESDKGLDHFKDKFDTINDSLMKRDFERLVEAEWIGGRLYTGPMFEKYNAVSRGGALEEGKQDAFMVKKFKEVCQGNRYTTTIHAINSALIKLSKLGSGGDLYRGMHHGVLPKQFWEPNEAWLKGGVEYGFLSCSKNMKVARQYLTDTKDGSVAKAATILQIKTGMVDKGADLSGFSQYPHEAEICFPPLTCLEMLGSRIEDSIMYLDMRLNVNFAALTIDQVISKRMKVVSDMCRNLQSEATAALDGHHWKAVVCDEHEAGLIREVVRELTKLKLKKITEDQDPQLFNNDERMLSAARRALEVTDSVKWQKSGLLREAARLLQNTEQLRKQFPQMVEEASRRPSFMQEGSMDAHLRDAGKSALRTAEDNSKIEVVAVTDILLKREDTRKLGLTQGSQRAHILESLQLVERDEVIKVHMPHKLLPGVEQGYILVKVNEQDDEQSEGFVQELVNESGATLKFVRPLSKEDLGASLDEILQSTDHPIEFAIARALALNPHIQRLDLRGKALGTKAGVALACALKTNLTVADMFLTGNKLGSKSAAAFRAMLRSNYTLKTLFIDSNDLQEDGGVALAEGLKPNDTLKTLRIRDNSIGKKGGLKLAEALESNCSLTTLGTERNAMGPEGGAAFAKVLCANSVLQALYIDDNSLGPDGGAEIAKALEKNSTLARLWIARNEIGERGGRAFAKALLTNKTLKHLGVERNSIGSEAGVEIAKALEANASLESLRIEQNGLEAQGGKAFASALAKNKKLVTLGICRNDLGNEAVAAICKSIEANEFSSLAALYMATNRIGVEGAKAIAKAVETNATLKVLNIEGNEIGPGGGKILFGVLQKSAGIQTLWLEDNNLCADGGDDLAAALRQNKSLEVLGLTKNTVSASVIAQIGDALKENSESPLQTLWLSREESSEEAIKEGQATLDSIPSKKIVIKCPEPR